jgi:hypothetical protein
MVEIKIPNDKAVMTKSVQILNNKATSVNRHTEHKLAQTQYHQRIYERQQ